MTMLCIYLFRNYRYLSIYIYFFFFSLQVQATASSAMDWCLKSGGRVEAGDMVSKIACLGAAGNHKSNIERDFHTLLKSFSRRLGAKLSTVRARTIGDHFFGNVQGSQIPNHFL